MDGIDTVRWDGTECAHSLKAKTKSWLTQEKEVRTIGIEMRLKSATIQTTEGICTDHGLGADEKVIECEVDTHIPCLGHILKLPHTNLSDLGHQAS